MKSLLHIEGVSSGNENCHLFVYDRDEGGYSGQRHLSDVR